MTLASIRVRAARAGSPLSETVARRCLRDLVTAGTLKTEGDRYLVA